MAALVTVVRRDPPTARASVLDGVGRNAIEGVDEHRIGCGCIPEPLLAVASDERSDGALLHTT